MPELIANSQESLHDAIGILRDEWNKHKYLRINYKSGKDRSLDFNAQSHVWYAQLARELREYDANGWKRFCKLHFGVPILRAEDDEFRTFYDLAIKRLTYEQKIQAMDHISVSSLMTNQQFKKFCDAMQEHFMTQHRVKLEFKEAKQ